MHVEGNVGALRCEVCGGPARRVKRHAPLNASRYVVVCLDAGRCGTVQAVA